MTFLLDKERVRIIPEQKGQKLTGRDQIEALRLIVELRRIERRTA